MSIFFIFSETSSILCSILAQIYSGCWWPPFLCTNSYSTLTKYPSSHPHTLISRFLAARKPLTPFLLIAFRTILCAGPPSWRTGPLSCRTVSSCGSLHIKHEFPVQTVLMCKQLHLPHTLGLEYWYEYPLSDLQFHRYQRTSVKVTSTKYGVAISSTTSFRLVDVYMCLIVFMTTIDTMLFLWVFQKFHWGTPWT